MALSDRFLAPPRTVAPEASAQLAAERMDNEHVGSLVVIDEHEHPVGILTDRDIALGVWWEWSQTGTWPCGSWATDGMAPAFR